MAVGEQVKILPVCGIAVGHPEFPIRVNRYKHLSVRLIKNRPAITRDNAFVVRFLGLDSVTAVKGSRGAKQVAAVIHSRMPSHGFEAHPSGGIRHPERHTQILLIEFLVSRICQGKVRGLDRQFLA